MIPASWRQKLHTDFDPYVIRVFLVVNVVMVKKASGKWRMCVDYSDLNKACPKDTYPLPCIDQLIDNTVGYELLSFLDTYSGYNQIRMYLLEEEKTTCMMNRANYYYRVMPFRLKNAGGTFQCLMDQVFGELIGDIMEVYVDDIVVKSATAGDHPEHLRKVMGRVRSRNLRVG